MSQWSVKWNPRKKQSQRNMERWKYQNVVVFVSFRKVALRSFERKIVSVVRKEDCCPWLVVYTKESDGGDANTP